jgi:hypothetical protein
VPNVAKGAGNKAVAADIIAKKAELKKCKAVKSSHLHLV